ncbi:MAG: MTAP family purine nucleoside phosphorylase [Candidatus Burarchaeum sp.]|nr:MTAP family purine nucleoside phosphorylase [Candidatus Burarchaeum sp.]MDO8339335.1 MTAP family purine nucleoside phosphorylase [Candidatus Burarchaeum sp.]
MVCVLGIIGGSGFYSVMKGEERHVETPFGWEKVQLGRFGKATVAFIPRHGPTHIIPPHKINHRANLYAMNKVGAKHVVGINACGIISKFRPGEIMTIADFLAFHLGAVTFHDHFATGAKHEDMSEPYSKRLNALIAKAGRKVKIDVKSGGVVATTFGPRFESPAEIKAFKMLGANLVSMTSAYEAILARELGLEYSSIAIGTNYAAGMSKKQLSHQEVLDMMAKSEAKVIKIVAALAGMVE